MAIILGHSKETGSTPVTMYSANNDKDINDKLEYLSMYYPELEIEIRR